MFVTLAALIATSRPSPLWINSITSSIKIWVLELINPITIGRPRSASLGTQAKRERLLFAGGSACSTRTPFGITIYLIVQDGCRQGCFLRNRRRVPADRVASPSVVNRLELWLRTLLLLNRRIRPRAQGQRATLSILDLY